MNPIKFYKDQNKILIIGGMLSVTTMIVGHNSTLVFLGMAMMLVTFIICDIRETKFKAKKL